MNKIHMETDLARQVTNTLNQQVDELLVLENRLNSASSQAASAWYGGSKSSNFHNGLKSLLKSYRNQVSVLDDLSMRLSREVDEWIRADSTGMNNFKEINIPRAFDITRQYNRTSFIIDGDTDYYLLHGVEVQAYEGYLKGDLKLKEAWDFINEDPFKKHLVKPSITFYSAEESGKLSLLDGQNATRYGNFGASLGSIEQHASGKIIFDEGALQAKAEAGAGGYVAKSTYNAEIAGVGIAAVGFAGAEANASGAIAFDPKKGEIGAKGEVDAFLGGKVEGSVSKKGQFAGMDGEVKAKGGISYGAGVEGKAEVGFSQGHIKGEIQGGVAVGVGAEFGISVDLDVQQAAENIIDTGKSAVEWLYAM